MRSTQPALRLWLLAAAGVLGAVAAHVVVDVAGDFLLARDAYDGIAHDSRALLLGLLAIGTMIAAIRTVFSMLDRHRGTSGSLLATVRDALGDPARFATAAAAIAILGMVAMESLDCVVDGRIADLTDLFGGSLLLGAAAAALSGALCGWGVHRLVRSLAACERPIAAFIIAAFRPIDRALAVAIVPFTRDRARAPRGGGRALSFARRGRKRGPPAPIPG